METKICKKCHQEKPLNKFELEGHKGNPQKWYRNICRKCRNKLRQPLARGALRKRIRENRKKATEFLGGKCIKCGYNRCFVALDFHHIEGREKDEKRKRRGYSLIQYYGWERLKKELEKCALLCANCHREFHQRYGRGNNTREQLKEFLKN